MALATAALLALAACATKPAPVSVVTRVVLLPQDDGSASAVVLTANNASQTVAVPYAQASARAGEAPQSQPATNAQAVQAGYASIFAGTPPKPQRFVVYFQPNGTQLTAASQRALSDALADAAGRTGAEILLVGHTDTTGNADANDALALRRANQVRDMFLARGVGPGLIEAAGRGEREPAVATRDNTEESRNRRVEIVVR